MCGLAFLLVLAHDKSGVTVPGKREFNSLYVQLNSKYIQRDVKGLSAFMRPDFMYIDSRGHGSRREEFVQSALTFIKLYGSPTDVETVDSMSVKGDTATLTVHEVFTGTVMRSDPPKKHIVKQSNILSDTWERSGKTWQLKRTVVRKIVKYFDGKLVPELHVRAPMMAPLGRARTE